MPSKRRLTAEEAAAAEVDAAVEQQQAETSNSSTSGTVRLATHPFHASFQVGDLVIHPHGVDVDADTAAQAHAAAEQSGITLRELDT